MSESRPPARPVRRLRIDHERLFYSGPLGPPALRRMRSLTIYVSLGAPLRCTIGGGGWTSGECVVVPPYVPHRMDVDGGTICDLLIEPEGLALERLPWPLRGACGAVDAPELVRRMRATATGARLWRDDVDTLVFGDLLPRRALDERIAGVVRELQRQPNAALEAEDFAAAARLSTSRFLHLFKSELGVSYRSFRAWKRARMLLATVGGRPNLAALAQAIGYADSTHLSHSIRQVYGMRPSEIFVGCRRVDLLAVAGRKATAGGGWLPHRGISRGPAGA